MRERVLDFDALAQTFAPRGRRNKLSEAMLERLIVSDRNGAPGTRGRQGALGAQRALGARGGIELDNVAGDERLDLARGTGDRARAHVDREVALSEDLPVARDPGLAKYLAAAREDLGRQRTVDVPAVDR